MAAGRVSKLSWELLVGRNAAFEAARANFYRRRAQSHRTAASIAAGSTRITFVDILSCESDTEVSPMRKPAMPSASCAVPSMGQARSWKGRPGARRRLTRKACFGRSPTSSPRSTSADKAKGFADEFRAKCAPEPMALYGGKGLRREGHRRPRRDHPRQALELPCRHASDIGKRPPDPFITPSISGCGKGKCRLLPVGWIEPRIGYIDLRRFYPSTRRRHGLAPWRSWPTPKPHHRCPENGGGRDYLSSYFCPIRPNERSFSRQTGA